MSEHKPSFLTRVRNVLVGTTVVAGGAMTAEATMHPVQNVIDKTQTGVERTVENIEEGKDALVNFYNEDPAIEKYNRDAEARLSGKSPLLEGEELIEKITIVPAGANYDELLQMKNSNEPVKVRAFPSKQTPTGNSIDILGTLPQGEEITNVIRVKGYQPGSEERGDWYGLLYKSPDSATSQMGYIYSIYAQPETSNVASSASE